MLKIGVDSVTERIRYVFDIIEQFRSVSFDLVEIKSEDSHADLYVYSTQKSVAQKGLRAASLLYNEEIQKCDAVIAGFGNEKCLRFDGIADPLAAIFYHLTRMEEYDLKPEDLDIHGRFQSKNSFVFQFQLPFQLLAERWIDAFLLDFQQQTGQKISTEKQLLKFFPTFDIDNTFAFKWKPFPRILGSFTKDFIHFDFERLKAKIKTLLNLQRDPYDTFDKISDWSQKADKIQLFWLLGDLTKYDRNVPNTSKKQHAFIQQLAQRLPIGLHPSYGSNTSLQQLQKEKSILETAEKQTVTRSRQHFLRLHFPETYQRNILVGMAHDFTMGFGDQVGFRAGTLRSYPFFDLTKNEVFDYWIHPFAYMDGTLKEYQKLSLDESKRVIDKLVEEAAKFGGDFCIIWHNETISEWHNWKNWSSLISYTQQKIHEVQN